MTEPTLFDAPTGTTRRHPAGPSEVSLAEARRAYQQGIADDGAVCPCCERHGRIQPRRLNAGMAASLVWLCAQKPDDDGYIDVPSRAPRFVLNNRELGRLTLWGLIEAKPNDDEHKRTSGKWRPTTRGRMFALGEIQVQSHALVYNRQLEGFDGEPVDVHACLGDAFDYRELRNGG